MFLALLLPVLLSSVAVFFALLAYTGWIFFGVDWQAKRKKQADLEAPAGGLKGRGPIVLFPLIKERGNHSLIHVWALFHNVVPRILEI